MKMYFIAVFVLLGTGLTVNSEKHSLTYIYTAFSKPVGLPGIHEFTAMGLLDGRMIDYYDSDLKKKVPKQPWMEEKLPADYWVKGTQSRLSKQQWFKVNIDILKKRMNQTDEDVHILQWMHGCEGEKRPGGGVTFSRSVFMFNYDGQDPTKTKWDGFQVLKEYTKDYLENECIDWLNMFLPYGQKQLQAAPPPEVYVFATNAKTETNVKLTCMATGFLPKDIRLEIKRDDRVLTKEDGLLTSGVRPNEDDTYQRRDSVEILRSDVVSYRCEVTHRATNVYVKKIWDGKLPDPPGGNSVGIIAVVIVVELLVIIVAAVLVLLYRNRNGSDESLCRGASGGSGSDESLCRGASGGSVAGLPNNYQDEPHDEDPAAQGGGLPINHQSVNKRLLKDEKEKKGSDWSLFMREIDRFWSRSRPRNRRSRPNASCVNKRLLKDEKEKKGSEGSLFMREIDRFWSRSRPRNRSSSPGPSFDEGAAAPGVLKHFLDEKEEKGSEGSLFMREIDRFYV